MKKKYLIISISFLLVLSICLYVFMGNNDEKVIFENESSSNHIVNTNALTMMYETEAGSGEYQVSSDTMWPQDRYIFNETLSKCENGGTLSWDSETNRVVMQTNSSDKCYVYFDAVYTAAMMITDLFNQGSDELGNLDPDGNIRYAGTNPNNYVMFNNELWRIIGIFNSKLKIVRDSYLPVIFEDNGITIGDTAYYPYEGAPNAGSVNFFYWDYNGTNNWETSTLKVYLNGTYYNNIEQNNRNLIYEETWYLGGCSNEDAIAEEFYEMERSSTVYSGNPFTTRAYIGLVYPSDIFYSKSTSSVPENDFNLSHYNWLGNKGGWLITSSINYNNRALLFYSLGGDYEFSSTTVNYNNHTYVRDDWPRVYPTLYLKSTTNIISGNGSEENPYILA